MAFHFILPGLIPAFLSLCAGAAAAITPPLAEGRTLQSASNFELQLKNPAGPTVLVFLSARCPCSISHEETLKVLATEFKEARFLAIHSNVDETAEETSAHFAKATLPFPIIQDENSALANRFGALKTPHVFVLNREGEVKFQGGIDDSHNASNARKGYLKAALLALRAGKTPEITQVRSLGCMIRR